MKLNKKMVQGSLTSLIVGGILAGCTSTPVQPSPAAPQASNPQPVQPAQPVADSAKSPLERANQVRTQATVDLELREALSQNPVQALKDKGLALDATAKVRTLSTSASELYLILDERNISQFQDVKKLKEAETATDTGKLLAGIRSKALADADFKQKLMADPKSLLKAEGLELPAEQKLTVLDYEADTHFFLLSPVDTSSEDDINRQVFELILDPILKVAIPKAVSVALDMTTKIALVATIEFLRAVQWWAPFDAYGWLMSQPVVKAITG
ncbi:MAG: hypothetical protein CVV27_09155 [Candidatus Melainabacteria bacterium HGW-Melainabacteria-1]|nr:MAG: hypothetical protein CVV27_09155 [Candidatus Melainabacteria bacterium HGW-Melainabacteria-1]